MIHLAVKSMAGLVDGGTSQSGALISYAPLSGRSLGTGSLRDYPGSSPGVGALRSLRTQIRGVEHRV